MMNLRKLPIGIQTFSEIVDGGYLYIDKTRHIHELITSGKYFFFSRPRRFGKSLTLSTIKSIYLGQRDLFAGLWIEDRWDWEKIHPVLHISFSWIGYEKLGLEAAIETELHRLAKTHGIELVEQGPALLFRELINKCSMNGKVVILIDEYDKPIIDYLDKKEQARQNQAILRQFYSVIKDSDPYIELLVITGISKFSKVSIFSALNNIFDITLSRRHSTLVGYTQQELEENFASYMNEAEEVLGISRDELLSKLKVRYNGYTWDGRAYVYNPFSILGFFENLEFSNYWFETGTPTFLLKLMREQKVYELENFLAPEQMFSAYDIDHLQAIPILFQTGYLTIRERLEENFYLLDYPNAEVRQSLLEFLVTDLREDRNTPSVRMVWQLRDAFQEDDMERVIELIRSIFKNVPSQIFISDAESYYHSLIYLVFFYLGEYAESEVNTNNGRLDCVVQTEKHIYVLEFKLDKSAEAALTQIKDRGYAEKYAADPRHKVLVGINFSSAEKTVESWLIEKVS